MSTISKIHYIRWKVAEKGEKTEEAAHHKAMFYFYATQEVGAMFYKHRALKNFPKIQLN